MGYLVNYLTLTKKQMKAYIFFIVLIASSIISCNKPGKQINLIHEGIQGAKNANSPKSIQTTQEHIYGHIRTDNVKSQVILRNPNDTSQFIEVQTVYFYKDNLPQDTGFVYPAYSNLDSHRHVNIILDPILTRKPGTTIYENQLECHLTCLQSDWITKQYFNFIGEESYDVHISNNSHSLPQPITIENYKIKDSLELKISKYQVVRPLNNPIPRRNSRNPIRLPQMEIYYRIPTAVTSRIIDARFVVYKNVPANIKGRDTTINYIINPINESDY